MDILLTNGIEVRYDIQGSGPWLILCHSLATDLTLWDDQMAALTPKFRVLRYDIRGHGGSSAPATAYDFPTLTADVLGMMDALGIEMAHFCGISAGGMIGQHVGLAAPERIDRLILVSTTSGYPLEARLMWNERIAGVRVNGVEPLVVPTLERWFTLPYRETSPDTMARIGNLIRATPAAGYIGLASAIAELDTTERLQQMRCRTLVIAGADDAGTPPAMGRTIAEQIPGACFELVSQASHLCNVEQKSRVNSLLRLFLEA